MNYYRLVAYKGAKEGRLILGTLAFEIVVSLAGVALLQPIYVLSTYPRYRPNEIGFTIEARTPAPKSRLSRRY